MENEKNEVKTTEEVFEQLKESIRDITVEQLDDNSKKAVGILASSLEIDQKLLAKQAIRMIKDIEQEKEIIKGGYTKYFTKDDLKGILIHYSRTNDTNILFNDLEEFDRVIPQVNRLEIEKAKNSGLFGQFYIIYTDYTNGGKLKTKSKNKKVTKDPIVFANPKNTEDDKEKVILSERLYVITDWVDEFCDLNLNKILECIKDTDYKLYDAVENSDVDISDVLEKFKNIKDKELLEKLIRSKLDIQEPNANKSISKMVLEFIGKLVNKFRKK